MEATTTQAPSKQEVQVYKNDFLNGIIRLTKKLFML